MLIRGYGPLELADGEFREKVASAGIGRIPLGGKNFIHIVSRCLQPHHSARFYSRLDGSVAAGRTIIGCFHRD